MDLAGFGMWTSGLKYSDYMGVALGSNFVPTFRTLELTLGVSGFSSGTHPKFDPTSLCTRNVGFRL